MSKSHIKADDASRLADSLYRAGLAEQWYRWCDRTRNWSKDATQSYHNDSLLTSTGAYENLPAQVFLDAFSTDATTVSKKATVFNLPKRSAFSVGVHEGETSVVLEVQLGKGTNYMDCAILVYQHEISMSQPEFLTGTAFNILKSRGEAPQGPDAPYPRPIISSYSHLEVVAREMTQLLKEVAHEWEQRRLRSEGAVN